MSHATHLATASAVASLDALLDGAAYTAAEPDWDTARTPWNLAVDQRPDVVVRAQSVGDVVAALDFAREHGLRLVPQGTGHAAAPLGDLAGCLLLRTTAFDGVTVDASASTATVGAGVTWSSLTRAARKHGLMGLYGTDDSVGVAGFVLGGGVSWFARQHGLACSSLVRARVVSGDGEVIDVDAEHHPDLFWALRGGGGGYGVVTELTMRLHPIVPVTAGAMWWPIDAAFEVVPTWLRQTEQASEQMTSALRFMRLPDASTVPDPIRGRAFVIVQLTALPGADADGWVAPLRAFPPVTDTLSLTTSDAVSAVHLAPTDPSPTAGDGRLLHDVPQAAADILLRLAGPGVTTPLAMVELRHVGGAAGRPDPRGGVLKHLPGRYLGMAGNVARDPGTFREVTHTAVCLWDALAPWQAERDYLNFREVAVPPDRFHDAPARRRLGEIRRRYDPEGVLRPNHVTW